MEKINRYAQDGADHQSRAVLAHLQGMISDGLEESWDKSINMYRASVYVSRWENCREQGYVCLLKNNSRQLNIAWFEHRNSDSICAVLWEQVTINAPTIDTANFGSIYKTKYDVSYSVGFGKYAEMGDWIFDQLKDFWRTTEIN